MGSGCRVYGEIVKSNLEIPGIFLYVPSSYLDARSFTLPYMVAVSVALAYLFLVPKRHISEDHIGNKCVMACAVEGCGYTYHRLPGATYNLIKHMKTHVEYNEYQCNVCGIFHRYSEGKANCCKNDPAKVGILC